MLTLKSIKQYIDKIFICGPCYGNWTTAMEYYVTGDIEGLLAIARGNYAWICDNLNVPEKHFWKIVGDGPAEIWRDDGQLASRYGYKDGQLHGEYKSWHINGQLNVQGHYKKSKRHGEFMIWNPSGRLMVHRYYKKDVLTWSIKI